MSIWKEYLKPVVVLVVICIIVSAGLAVTNSITAPIIEENAAKTANAARQELIPDADGFEELAVEYNGVTAMYKATNLDAYVVTAEAKGYGGMVPVMVAFGEDGKILSVKFMSNDETPGLGQKVKSEAFQGQFSGMEAESFTLSDIDAISGATISSSAATTAINNAIAAYKGEAKGEVEIEWTEENILAAVLPEAGAITPIDGTWPTATAAYKGESYGIVVVAEVPGFYKKPVVAYVGFDDSGVITGVYIDGNNETVGVGQQVTGVDFGAQFVGQSSIGEPDMIAGATVSSTAAVDAVKAAVSDYSNVKGAA